MQKSTKRKKTKNKFEKENTMFLIENYKSKLSKIKFELLLFTLCILYQMSIENQQVRFTKNQIFIEVANFLKQINVNKKT